MSDHPFFDSIKDIHWTPFAPKVFNPPLEIEPLQDYKKVIAHCYKFATDMDQTVCYGNRDGQYDSLTRIKQSAESKICEVLFWYQWRFSFQPPDMNVYEKARKSHAPDLIATEEGLPSIEIKNASKYRDEISWVVQDSFLRHAENHNTMTAFVEHVEGTGVLRVYAILPYQFFEPHITNTKKAFSKKQAIYWKTLQKECI